MSRPARTKVGKVALVTGAARGLGFAYASRLASEGATVIGVDRSPPGEFEASMAREGAPKAEFHQIDVADEQQVRQCAAAIIDKHGRCDCIVNNAGVAPHIPFAELTLEQWRRTMSINVDSMFLICSAFVPNMIKLKYGRIVTLLPIH